MLEHRFSNQFFILQDETFNPKTMVSALTSYPNVKKFQILNRCFRQRLKLQIY